MGVIYMYERENVVDVAMATIRLKQIIRLKRANIICYISL